MGDDSLILREDGYLNVETDTTSIIYHNNLNVILLTTQKGLVHVLDVNSGVILQSSSVSENGLIGVDYVPGADRIVFWDKDGISARVDYNGVLLLQTALQQPLSAAYTDKTIKMEFVLSEAILLNQCLQSIEFSSSEGVCDVNKSLSAAVSAQIQDNERLKKGVKAQKWSTVCLEMPQAVFRLVANEIVSELKKQSRRVPALPIASAIGQRANDLVLEYRKRDMGERALMFSEATRKETFKKWPHGDYKWALPAQMAQAGFYHQPSSTGDDRAMCFTCSVCLVCWERTDEPWAEHERHSPNCPFVKGEYTHNVPLSVTNATSCAVPSPSIKVVSKGNYGEIIATGTADGKVSIWRFDCGLKLEKSFQIYTSDPVFSKKISHCSDSQKNWAETNQKETNYDLELTALAIIGLPQKATQQPPSVEGSALESRSIGPDPAVVKSECDPASTAAVCAVSVSWSERTHLVDSWDDDDIWEDSPFAAENSNASEVVRAMNNQNDAKNYIEVKKKMLFLLTYDLNGVKTQSPTPGTDSADCDTVCKAGGSKKVSMTDRTDEANIYDEIFLSKYPGSDEDAEPLPAPASGLDGAMDDQITVINLNSLVNNAAVKEIQNKFKENNYLPKNWKMAKLPHTTKMFPLGTDLSAMQAAGSPHPVAVHSLNDGTESMFQEYMEAKAAAGLDEAPGDQPDSALAVVVQHDSELNYMNGTFQLSDLLYEYSNSGIKMKVPVGDKIKGINDKLKFHDKSLHAIQPHRENSIDDDTSSEEGSQPTVLMQCLSLPTKLAARHDLKVTHTIPTNDGSRLLVVVASNKLPDNEFNHDESEMEVDACSDGGTKSNEYINGASKNTGYLLTYNINFIYSTLIETPLCVREIPYEATPIDLCTIPTRAGNTEAVAVISKDGSLILVELQHLTEIVSTQPPTGRFVSVAYCASSERISACTEKGVVHFYATGENEQDSNGDMDDEEVESDKNKTEDLPLTPIADPSSSFLVNKESWDNADLDKLTQLSGLHRPANALPFSAIVPGCWCSPSPSQRPRTDMKDIKTWRLQNTTSTWDEHMLEITLPYSASLAYVELRFVLHAPCPAPPNIQVTLLKQSLHGIGYRKDSCNKQAEEPSRVKFSLIDSDVKSYVENPVNSKEYLKAHNADILAGPLLLTQGLDLTQQAGSLTLTSPRLYRSKGRTFLIHIKTLFDPSKEMTLGKVSSYSQKTFNLQNASTTEPTGCRAHGTAASGKQKTEFIGCDWLHQISVMMCSNNRTELANEKQQRVAMLENNTFMHRLFKIAVDSSVLEKQSTALDLLIWVLSVRLQRFRSAKSETCLLSSGESAEMSGAAASCIYEAQQVQCVRVVRKHVDSLIRNCILCAERSVAKKAVKIILITSEGVRNMPGENDMNFMQTVLQSMVACIPLLGVCPSASSLRWLSKLAMHVVPLDTDGRLHYGCLKLLQDVARHMEARTDPYHMLLQSRFGLYGLPLESKLFATEPPVLGKSTSTPLTFASVVSSYLNMMNSVPQPEIDLRDLYNLNEAKTSQCNNGNASTAWWSANNSCALFGTGLGEELALHVTCHYASDGTKLEQGGNWKSQLIPSVVTEPSQLRSLIKQSKLDVDAGGSAEEAGLPMECDAPATSADEASTDEGVYSYESEGNMIPWQRLVQQPSPQSLLVERMHSGARRYIVLDFGLPVRLTDLIIPCCTELLSLTVEVWLQNEYQDGMKLVNCTDISVKNLIMTDIQPAPLCRYIKITTIGRYGMSTTRCKIPLGWFYGQVEPTPNMEMQIKSLMGLKQDVMCRYRLATGKLMDLLNVYMEQYNGYASHISSFLKNSQEADPRVYAAYQECMDLQHQLYNINNLMSKYTRSDSSSAEEELLGGVEPEELLRRSSLDKLRVISDVLVQMLLNFSYEGLSKEQAVQVQLEVAVSREWCERVVGGVLVGAAPRAAAACAALLARTCARSPWWGDFLADTLAHMYTAVDKTPFPRDRFLIILIFMARKTLMASAGSGKGVVVSVVTKALQLLPGITNSDDDMLDSGTSPVQVDPTLLVYVLVYLAACLDACAAPSAGWSRWDFVSGGGSSLVGARQPGLSSSTSVYRRKLPKRLVRLKHTDEAEAARRVSQQVQALIDLSTETVSLTQKLEAALKSTDNLKSELFTAKDIVQQRIGGLGKRGASGSGSSTGCSGILAGLGQLQPPDSGDGPSAPDLRLLRFLPTDLALRLAKRLIDQILTMDFTCNSDLLILCAKVVGRLSGVCGGLPGLVRTPQLLGLARAACSLPAWPRHALTVLLQDIVEFDGGGEFGEGSVSTDCWDVVRAPTPCGRSSPSADSAMLKVARTLCKLRNSNSNPNLPSMEYQMPSLMESDDSDIDEFLEQYLLDRSGINITAKKNAANKPAPPPPGTAQESTSSAVDSRMECGIELYSEVLVRRLALLGASTLSTAIESPPIGPLLLRVPRDESATPPAPHTHPQTHHSPPSLTEMFTETFNTLFAEFELQDDSQFMEQVLSLWLTLNGSIWGSNSNTSSSGSGQFWGPMETLDNPRLKLSPTSMHYLLNALVQQDNISLRCWVLAMACMSWVVSVPVPQVDSVSPPQTMAQLILEDSLFVQAMVKLASTKLTTDGVINGLDSTFHALDSNNWLCTAGMGVSGSLQWLLARLASGCDSFSTHAVLLRILCALAAPGGAVRARSGALDVQAALVHAALLHTPHYTPQQLPHAMSLIESIAYIACECGGGAGGVDGARGGAECGSGSSEAALALGGLLSDVMRGPGETGSPGSRTAAVTRRALVAMLLKFARKLVTLPLTGNVKEALSADKSGLSQTDESKASAQATTDHTDASDQRDPVKVACLADTVLQHHPTMQRLFKTLANSTPSNIVMTSATGSDCLTGCDTWSVSDEMFKLMITLADTATHPQRILASLLTFLREWKGGGNWGLSEALVWFILRTLEKPLPMSTFVSLGGVSVVTERLVASHRAQLDPRPGLVSSLMNYLKLPEQLLNLSTPAAHSANNKKTQQPSVDCNVEGLINFAPMGVISSGNPTAQAADVLLGAGGSTSVGAGGGAHRRVRAATWSYHFYQEETYVELLVRLPHAVLLHEVHLQPHLASLATCPSAVSLEVSGGGATVPLGPPQPTAGMTFIRLALLTPVVASSVQLRLYKPRDSSNLGLLHLRILGTSAFSMNAPHNEKLASTSAGWLRILALCLSSSGSVGADVLGGGGGGSSVVSTCAALLASGAGGEVAQHAHTVLMRLALEDAVRAHLLMRLLLRMDGVAHAHGIHQPEMQVNGTSAMDSICELLYQLCVHRDEHTRDRLETFLSWISSCATEAVRGSAQAQALQLQPSSAYIQCLATVLWMLKEEALLDNLEELVCDELFMMLLQWLDVLKQPSLLKTSLDSVLCSMCFIRPSLFGLMLKRIGGVSEQFLEDSLTGSDEMLTDDRKVDDARAGENVSAVPTDALQLKSIAACAMSPEAAHLLLRSHLPLTVIMHIQKFCNKELRNIKSTDGVQRNWQMTDSDKGTDLNLPGGEVKLTSMPILVEWLTDLCGDKLFKDWLGGPVGSSFWKPLLLMLCLSDPTKRDWECVEVYNALEERTIALLTAITSCHHDNQQLFAATLLHILKCHGEIAPGVGEPISSFTRGLILRLVLCSERASVAVVWGGGSWRSGRRLHPRLHRHAHLTVPLHTTVRDLLINHIVPMSGSGSGSGGTWWGGLGACRASRDASESEAARDKRAKEASAKQTTAKTILNNTKKRYQLKPAGGVPPGTDGSPLTPTPPERDSPIMNGLTVHLENSPNPLPASVTMGQLATTSPHRFGAQIMLKILPTSKIQSEWTVSSAATWESCDSVTGEGGGGAVSRCLLSQLASVGALARLAAHLPTLCVEPLQPPAPVALHDHVPPDTDWVKLDDIYEEVAEGAASGASGGADDGAAGVPQHALLGLSLLLRLPGYAEALLQEGTRALHLLRLLLGVTDDGDGRNIFCSVGGAGTVGSSSSMVLGVLPFRVLSALLESTAGGCDDALLLRRMLMRVGALKLMLTCLAVFTHQAPDTPPESQASNSSSVRTKAEDKNQLYWAKGTGFGTGSTQQAWNVEQALCRQKTEEEHITVLLQVIASYINPGERWPPTARRSESGGSGSSTTAPAPCLEPELPELPQEFGELLQASSLIPAICGYLRNDSVLDMSRHIPLYLGVLRVVRALGAWAGRTPESASPAAAAALRSLTPLVQQMGRTIDTYATKLRGNRSNIFGKSTYSQRFGPTGDIVDEDEGLAVLIMDVQATASLICREQEEECGAGVDRPLGASRDARYIELMKRLQFETFDMLGECADRGYKFNVSYHFESAVRAAGERAHPARMKRLVQEVSTLATSLPLSYSSSVFVRTDTDRLDVMKVLITGPSDTPYANGCFELDVYFPPEYPTAPMLINLETTGRHSVRFNPNLYNDGKVCLSVLNTWHGRPEEKWNAHTSSFLQVLVSIQSLILVPEPYFNEPGYERSRGTAGGTHLSLEYNSNIYQACVRWAMLEQLRNPTPCFKQVIQTHFWIKRDEICRVVEGWIAELEAQAGDKRSQRSICFNTIALKRHYKKLREELSKLPVPPGMEDLQTAFSASPSPTLSPPAPTPAPTPTPPTDHDMEKLVSQVLE